jgi:ABC-2 family transporter
MTAITGGTAARTGSERERGTLPRLGMVWVTWRQHRVALAGVIALLAGLSLVLLINGLKIRGTYSSLGLASCHGASRCQVLRNVFANDYFGTALQAPRFLEFVPGVIGAFLGAPLLAREFETGTYRFAWAQGVGRMRLVASKLVLLALAVTALALAFSQVFTWWYRPFEPVIARMISGQAFEVEGVVFAARALLAFMLGVLAGAMLRRVVPALAVTLAGWLAIAWPTAAFLRPHFQAPITVAVAAGDKLADWGTAWTVGDWWVGPDGKRVSQSAMNALVRRISAQKMDVNTWLTRHHYVLWESYQPGSRFWRFQVIEGAGLLILSLMLAAAALYWVRRRAA